MTTHLPRLGRALRDLLRQRRIAALATVGADGAPFASMVPFAIDTQAQRVVLHVSALAAHTGNMISEPRVSLLIMSQDQNDAPVHDLARAAFDALACTPERNSPKWCTARHAYLARFPEAEPMAQLPDFRFVALQLTGARQIAGFGAARSIGEAELALLLSENV